MGIRSTSNTEAVTALFTFEKAVLDRIRTLVAQKATELAEKARAMTKGRIAASIKVKTIDNDYSLKGVVFSKWYIARFYDLGYGGKTIQVKSYPRRVKSKDVKEKLRNAKGRMVSKIATKGTTLVQSHDRKLPRIHKPFMTAALDSMRAGIKQALQDAIRGAANGTK
jgi:hypothetical protein